MVEGIWMVGNLRGGADLGYRDGREFKGWGRSREDGGQGEMGSRGGRGVGLVVGGGVSG